MQTVIEATVETTLQEQSKTMYLAVLPHPDLAISLLLLLLRPLPWALNPSPFTLGPEPFTLNPGP